jgi:hypothetical protein
MFETADGMLVPTAYSGSIYWKLLLPFVLLFRHGYCLVKKVKSIRELVMFKNKDMDH